MMCRQAAGDHHDPGGLHVQAMHDPGPGQLGQLRRMSQQGVDQGAVGVARGRVDGTSPAGLFSTRMLSSS